MGKIIILDENTSNKIAAGEVIERPASVVKELVENSIDAGASIVTVEIKNGGISYIKVTDNGSGIEEDDAVIAFDRHATSKIRNSDDLEKISTLGFRGEALASIAAVSTVELTTRTKQSDYGCYVRVQGGVVKETRHTGCPPGTTFVVRDLFYNTPARFKFLKKDTTEAGYISDIINRIALGNPHISFKFISGGSTVIHTPGNNDLRSTIFSVYGRDIARQILEVNYEDSKIKITGYIGKPDIARSNRNHQSFFINRRYIRSKVITSAVDEAFKTYLIKNKFPFIVLNIEINPLYVDINVHPTKMEVRFSDDQEIFRSVYHAVNNALLGEFLVKNVQLGEKEKNPFRFSYSELQTRKFEQQNIDSYGGFIREASVQTDARHCKDEDYGGESARTANTLTKTGNLIQDKAVERGISRIYASCAEESKLKGEGTQSETGVSNGNCVDKISGNTLVEGNCGQNKEDGYMIENSGIFAEKSNKTGINKENIALLNNVKIIGQAFLTYIILQSEDALIIIDQHAAHERIMYEKLKKKFETSENMAQMLLSPVIIELTHQELKLVEEKADFFNKIGFIYENFGNNSIILRSTPVLLDTSDIRETFMDMVDRVSSFWKTNYDRMVDEAIYAIACKAAVKANRRMDDMEIKKLLEDLMLLGNPYTCPHGRPALVRISRYEFEKMFKRVV